MSPVSPKCKTSGKWTILIMSLQCPRRHVWRIIMEPPKTVIFQICPLDDQSNLDLRTVEAGLTMLFFTYPVWIGNRQKAHFYSFFKPSLWVLLLGPVRSIVSPSHQHQLKISIKNFQESVFIPKKGLHGHGGNHVFWNLPKDLRLPKPA